MTALRHDRFRNLIVAGAGNIATAVLSIAYVALVGRSLGPALYADFSASLAASYVLIAALAPITLVTLQVASAANAAGNRSSALASWRPVIARSATTVVVLSVATALAIPLITDLLQLRSTRTLYVALAVVLATSFSSVLRALPRAVGDYGVHAAASTGEAMLRLLIGAVLLSVALSPAIALSAYVAAAGLIAVVIIVHSSREAGSPPRVGPIWMSLFGALVLSVGTSLASNIDTLIAKSRLPAFDAGVYGAAATLARAAALVLIPIEILLLPALAHAGSRIPQTLGRLAGFALLCVGPVLAAFVLFRHSIVAFVFGDAFAPAANVLVILTLNATFVFATLLLGQLFLHARRLGFLWIIAIVPLVQTAVLLRFGHSIHSIAVVTTIVQSAGFAAAAIAGAWLALTQKSRLEAPDTIPDAP